MTLMMRLFTTACVAAALAAGLSAQSTGTATSQDPTTAGGQGRGGGPRTITGCLRAGDTAGTYMLTDVTGLGGGRGRGGDTTAAGTAAGTGTTAGAAGTATGTGTTAGAAAGGQGRGGPQTIMLSVATGATGVDLNAHVGHKIEVTGTLAGGGRRGGEGAAGGTTATGTATGAGGTTAGGTTAGGTTAAGTGTSASGGGGQGGGRGGRSMTVTAIRHVAPTCS
jgi:hypothetical protein